VVGSSATNAQGDPEAEDGYGLLAVVQLLEANLERGVANSALRAEIRELGANQDEILGNLAAIKVGLNGLKDKFETVIRRSSGDDDYD